MSTPQTEASTSDAELYCACALSPGDEVKVEIDDGAIFVVCPRCGRQVPLETVSVHAAPRAATLTAQWDVDHTYIWLEARI